MKQVIAFDLDGTLAESKSALDDRMAELLNELLEKFQVCVISGGKFEQFQKQLLSNLKASPAKLEKLHLMPTCGTQYYTFDVAKGDWQQNYAENFTQAEKDKIVAALTQAAEELGYLEEKPYGEIVEDRDSQIAFSALGQDIIEVLGDKGVQLKKDWDPTNEKKAKLRDRTAQLIPEFEVRAGGLTTIDVTKLGIDKAYGMNKLMDMLDISKGEILFMGDRLAEGGNDYPVKAMGIDSIEVSSWEDTAIAVTAILHIV